MSYMPGPGDVEAWPMTITPRDPRYVEQDPEALAALRNEALGVIADSIAEERTASLAWVNDAQSDYLNEEYDAITSALQTALLAGESPETLRLHAKIGELMTNAVRAAIRRGALSEAAIRLSQIEKEDEADYYDEAIAS